jgi:hypothetical protein
MAQTKSLTVNGKATTVTIDDPALDPVPEKVKAAISGGA